MFQSTPPRGGRLQTHADAQTVLTVSIHAPTWGATSCATEAQTHTWFQSTPPRGGRPTRASAVLPLDGFNPRPHVGGDWVVCAVDPRPLNVSIHAPTWGATVLAADTPRLVSCFNPRPHVGGDLEPVAEVSVKRSVSIHAPTWGATPSMTPIPSLQVFQSTPPRGGRLPPR